MVIGKFLVVGLLHSSNFRSTGIIAFMIISFLFQGHPSIGQKYLEPRLIFETENKLPRISPDGRYFSFINRTNRHPAIYDRQTGKIRNINSQVIWGGRSLGTGQSIWSPDSKSLIFHWVENGGFSLKKFDIITGAHHDLVDAYGLKVRAWPVDHSPDGKYLLGIIGSGRNAYFGLIPIAGGHIDSLDITGHAFKSISPDGTNILYDSRTQDYDHDISIYSLRNRKSKQLISSSRPEHVMTWIDNRSFIYTVVGPHTNEIWKVVLDENMKIKSREMLSDQMRGWYPVGKTNNQRYSYFSREGWSEIFYRSFDKELLEVEDATYVANIKNNIRIQPGWSKTGHLMIYSGKKSSVSNDFEIEELITATGEIRSFKASLPVHLTPDEGSMISSPDRSRLIISVFNGTSRLRDCLLVEKSGKIDHIIEDCQFPNFSTDQQVYFISGAQIIRLDLTKNDLDTLYSGDQRISHLSVSRNGGKLAFYEGPYGQFGPDKLIVINVSDKVYRIVTQLDSGSQFTPSSGPNWFSDDKTILVSVSDEPLTSQQLMLVSIPSAKMRHLGKRVEVGEGIMHHINLHPSEQKITYSVITDITKVWEIDLPANE